MENLNRLPAIIASNHQSMWETFVYNHIFPPHAYVIKKELLKLPFFGWGIRAAYPIAIDRKDGVGATVQVMTQGKQRFEKGFWIMAFPEGTRVVSGERKPFKLGMAKLAINLNVPIIPVAHNAGHVLPKKSFWFYPGTVTIIIGKPIYPNSDNSDMLMQQVKAWIYARMDEIGA